jgi:amidohydrolase
MSILQDAEQLFGKVRNLRRDFHRHPELGFQETRTAGIVAQELTELGLQVKTGIAQTGVTALLQGDRPGKVVMLRFDMDALPIQEENKVEYVSQIPGVMHACGHDGHTAIGLTVADLLWQRRKQLAGTIKFVFQPAEEGLGGAKEMVAAGVLENPQPDVVLGLHLWNEKPTGWYGITAGEIMAASEIFEVKIIGKGSHGALPHQGVDPILATAQVINALQGIVGRNVPPMETAVISVTSIQGGEAFNVLPSAVQLKGTMRTFTPEVRELVLKRFREIVERVAEGMGCQAEVDITNITPALINDPSTTQFMEQVVGQLFPHAQVDTDYRTMGSEDMAYFMESIAGCFFLVGSANEQKGLNALHHHPRFDFDERALVNGVALLSGAVISMMK